MVKADALFWLIVTGPAAPVPVVSVLMVPFVPTVPKSSTSMLPPAAEFVMITVPPAASTASTSR